MCVEEVVADSGIGEAPSDGLGACNGASGPSGAKEETMLVPVSTPSSQPVSVTPAPQPARFARDAMEKLDELCRSRHEGARLEAAVPPPSSAATAIPVQHETTSRGGR